MNHKLLREIQNRFESGKKYNTKLSPVISEDNRKRLILLSGIVAVAMLAMLVGSYFAESLEKNRVIYIVICMICACISLATVKQKSRFVIAGMMYLFIGIMFVFGILLGTVIEPNETSVSFPILLFAMTANAFEEDRREALRAGMNGHLAKPINVNELMKALAGILG